MTMPVNSAIVSIYIATRNRSQLLRRAIQSVLAQRYEEIELIVVDDCSDDDTESVVRNLIAGNDTKKKIVYHKLARPSGACVARNAAIDCATGTLITGLDDDDYFAPGRIASLVNAFDPSTCAFVFDGYMRETVLSDGKIRRWPVPLKKRADISRLLLRNIVGNQVLTTTDRLRAVGGFDETLPAWQDYDLWIRLVRIYGAGRPAGGISYHYMIDHRLQRISRDPERIRVAWHIFLQKHMEYQSDVMRSFLSLSKACYGFDHLTWSDLRNIAGSGELYLTLSATYFFVRNRVLCG